MLRQNDFHGLDFTATGGTTQGGLVSPTLFNVVEDNVIRSWMAMMVEYQRVYHDGLGDTVRRCLGVFYAENCMVGSRNSDWLQHVMNVLARIFRRYGVAASVAKSRTMTCQTGALQAGMLEEAMALKCMGVGDSYPSETLKADTMPVVWVVTHRGVHDGTPLPHARDQYCNRLESAAGHPDSTPTPGVRHEISADDKAVTLPLPRMPGILPHVELPML